MKNLFFLMACLSVTPSALAWSRYDSYPNSNLTQTNEDMKARLGEVERQLEQSNFQHQLELDNAQRAIDSANQEAAERAEQSRREAEEVAAQARQEAEDRAAELEMSAQIKSANNNNLGYALGCLVISGLALYKIVRDKKQRLEDKLKPNEKAGVCIVLAGIIVALISLFISTPWIPRYDIWQHLVGLGALEGISFILPGFNVLIYAKHIVLACIILITYGVTVYLEIFNAPQIFRSFFEGR